MDSGYPGYLLGPANEETLKTIYQLVQKGTIHEYKGGMGAVCTLQQLKARAQNKAFS